MEKKEKILNLPNCITATRLLFMIPCIALGIAGNITTAGLWFILAASTDGIDGFVARKLHQVTKFGAHFDAIVDKIIMLGVLPMVFLESPLIIINLFYELTIGLLNTYSTKVKKNHLHTSQLGRKKQVLLCILLTTGYLKNVSPIFSTLSIALVPLTAIIQHCTLRNYYQTYQKAEQKKKEQKIITNMQEIEMQKTTDNNLVKEKEINPLIYQNKHEKIKIKTIGAKKINR